MDAKLFYMLVIIFVVMEMAAAAYIDNQRKKLDHTKPETAAREKGMKLLVKMLCIQAVVIPVILIFVVKPLVLAP